MNASLTKKPIVNSRNFILTPVTKVRQPREQHVWDTQLAPLLRHPRISFRGFHHDSRSAGTPSGPCSLDRHGENQTNYNASSTSKTNSETYSQSSFSSPSVGSGSAFWTSSDNPSDVSQSSFDDGSSDYDESSGEFISSDSQDEESFRHPTRSKPHFSQQEEQFRFVSPPSNTTLLSERWEKWAPKLPLLLHHVLSRSREVSCLLSSIIFTFLVSERQLMQSCIDAANRAQAKLPLPPQRSRDVAHHGVRRHTFSEGFQADTKTEQFFLSALQNNYPEEYLMALGRYDLDMAAQCGDRKVRQGVDITACSRHSQYKHRKYPPNAHFSQLMRGFHKMLQKPHTVSTGLQGILPSWFWLKNHAEDLRSAEHALSALLVVRGENAENSRESGKKSKKSKNSVENGDFRRDMAMVLRSAGIMIDGESVSPLQQRSSAYPSMEWSSSPVLQASEAKPEVFYSHILFVL